MLYRQTRNAYENCNRCIFEGVGEYGIPCVKPENINPSNFIGFNYVKGCKEPHNLGVHFFIDDYQFSRVWTDPDAYIEKLAQFKCVCTPDFSLYRDFPKAIQLYNHYRKCWLGAYWQQNGITVIPTVTWSDEMSFEWCFDGVPHNSMIAVSSVGTQVDKEAKRLFEIGYNKMLEVLEPASIYFYGCVPQGIDTANTIQIPPFYKSVRQRCNDRR